MNFSKKNLNKVESVSIVVLILGIILYNFESTYILGIALFAVSGFSVIAAARYKNKFPLNKQEIESWETIRKKGKSNYILSSVRFGLIALFGYFVFRIIKSSWSETPLFDEAWYIDIILPAVLFFGIPFLIAIDKWKFEEARYKEAVSQKDQPQ